jgi:hypothetical protein
VDGLFCPVDRALFHEVAQGQGGCGLVGGRMVRYGLSQSPSTPGA